MHPYTVWFRERKKCFCKKWSTRTVGESIANSGIISYHLGKKMSLQIRGRKTPEMFENRVSYSFQLKVQTGQSQISRFQRESHTGKYHHWRNNASQRHRFLKCCIFEGVLLFYLYHKVVVVQSYLTLCDTMDYSLPGSSFPRILQARILGWVATPFSRGSSWSRDWTWVSALQADSLLSELPGKPRDTKCSQR